MKSGALWCTCAEHATFFAMNTCGMQALAKVERAYMAANSRTKLIALCIILVLESSAWPMQVQIQTEAR